jgi:hypothetical protein
MKNKIYLYMCGGLGNQLFQYAAAKNLAIKNNAQLIIDTGTGFITDFRDFWKFSLDKRKLTNVQFKKFIFFFLFYRVIKKIFKLKKIFYKFNSFCLINEMNENKFKLKIYNFNIKKNLYLMGYFQSSKYFEENKKSIIKEILPPLAKKKIFLDLKRNMVQSDSVALGIRLHETMPQNITHKVGGIVSYNFYKIAIRNLLKKIKKPKFFIFSTKNSHIDQLLLKIDDIENYPKYIITEENGYVGSANDSLWLLSFCKNHIFSNSTFYWWGAYFSTFRYKKKIITCSGKFPNTDTCPDNWLLK